MDNIFTKLKKIKLFILDVDGVLTNGKVFWSENSGWTRTFSVKDGYGLKMLSRLGIELAIISGGSSRDLKERAKVLSISHLYLGSEDKIIPYQDLKEKTGYKDDVISYIGDELFDIPLLQKVGLSATVSDAPKEVKREVDYITKNRGGKGAVREVVDMIRYAHKSDTQAQFEALYKENYE